MSGWLWVGWVADCGHNVSTHTIGLPSFDSAVAREMSAPPPSQHRKSIKDLCWASQDPQRQAKKRTETEAARRNAWRTRFREAAFGKSLLAVADQAATGGTTVPVAPLSLNAADVWPEIRQFLGHVFGSEHFGAAAQAFQLWWVSRWLVCPVAQRKQVWVANGDDLRLLLTYAATNAFQAPAQLPWLCVFRALLRELATQAKVTLPVAAAPTAVLAEAPAVRPGVANLVDTDLDEDAADDAAFWNAVEDEEEDGEDGEGNSSSSEDGDDDADASEGTMQWMFTEAESVRLLITCRQLLCAEHTPVEVLEVICHICDVVWTVPQLQSGEVPCRVIGVEDAFQLLTLTVQRDRDALAASGAVTLCADIWATVLFFLLHAMPMRSELLSQAEAAALLPLLQHIAGRVGHLHHHRAAVSFLGVLHLAAPLPLSAQQPGSSGPSVGAVAAVAPDMPLLMSPPWASLLQAFATLPAASAAMTSYNWSSTADAWRTLRAWAEERGVLLAANVELGAFVLAQLEKILHATPILLDGNAVRHGHGPMLDCWNSVAEVSGALAAQDTVYAAQFRHRAINLFAPWFATGENASLLHQIERAWTRVAPTNVHARRLLPMVQCLQQSFLRLLAEWCMMQSPDSLAKQFPSFVLAPLTRYLQVLSEFAVETIAVEQQRREQQQQQQQRGVSLNTSAVSDTSIDSNQSSDVVLFPVVRESCVTQFNAILAVLQALLFASLPEAEWCAMLQQSQSNASIWSHVARVANTLRAGITNVLGERMDDAREVNPVRRLLSTMHERYPGMYHAELHSHVVDWPEEVNDIEDDNTASDSEDAIEEDEDAEEEEEEDAQAEGEDALMDG